MSINNTSNREGKTANRPDTNGALRMEEQDEVPEKIREEEFQEFKKRQNQRRRSSVAGPKSLGLNLRRSSTISVESYCKLGLT